MDTVTFEYRGTTYRVRRATVRSQMRRVWVTAALADGQTPTDEMFYQWGIFARLAAQTTVEAGTPPVWLTALTDAEGIRAAFEAWCEEDAALLDLALAALAAVDAEMASTEPGSEKKQPTS